MKSKKRTEAEKEILTKIEKTKKHEKIRIASRRRAQKKGYSIATQKSSGKKSKPITKRRPAKKRSSIR